LTDLAAARSSIHMQYFIWECDELTARITQVLLDRLRAGVEVFILNDLLGCIAYKKTELKRLAAAGAVVSYDMKQVGRLNYRNHRKITVVDGIIGHTGGINIGQEYIDGGKHFPAWRDTGLRITGPAVVDLAKLFADRWYEVRKESLYRDEYFEAGRATVSALPLAVQTVAHGVEDPFESARRAHSTAIGGASERVWLQSPYFVPDQGTYGAMVNAALSGVDVRLMMTDWPDKKMALRAAESFYKPMLVAGGRIFRYTKGFFHAKSITVDGVASAVGTMNLDMRSLKLHKELMVWCFDAGVAKRCEQIFEDDLADCREITLQEVEQWGAGHRWTNSAARLGSNLM
jgi:cardiolipin synthase A/B